jgi:lysophospholipase L1-like esterase
MKTKNKLVLACVWLSITIFILCFSLLNSSLQIIVPTYRQTIIIALWLLGLYAISGLIFLKRMKHIIFLLLPYIVFFIMLEGGTRLWISYVMKPSARLISIDQLKNPANLGLETAYVPHYYTLYNLRPNFSTTKGTIHNNIGLRDHRNFPAKKHCIRIVFIGGSTTYTIGIKNNTQIFSYALEQRLNTYYHDKFAGYEIQVINAGMGGATSAENLLRLIFFVSEISPDLVVIQHGLNDIWTRATKVPIKSDFSNYRKGWDRLERKNSLFSKNRPILIALTLTGLQKSMFLVYVFKRLGYLLPNYNYHDPDQENNNNTLAIGTLVSRSDVKRDVKYLEQNGTKYFARNTRYMIAICRAIGSQVLLVTEPYTKKAGESRNIAMPDHNALLAKIARDENVLFYDFAQEMIKDDAHMPDGRHMSQIGSDLKSDLFFQYFVNDEIIPQLFNHVISAKNISSIQ